MPSGVVPNFELYTREEIELVSHIASNMHIFRPAFSFPYLTSLVIIIRNQEYNRPLLGMQVNTLYSAEVAELEIIMRKFPDGLKGIIVEEVCSPLPILFTLYSMCND